MYTYTGRAYREKGSRDLREQNIEKRKGEKKSEEIEVKLNRAEKVHIPPWCMYMYMCTLSLSLICEVYSLSVRTDQ
jgi:hypothetical protein